MILNKEKQKLFYYVITIISNSAYNNKKKYKKKTKRKAKKNKSFYNPIKIHLTETKLFCMSSSRFLIKRLESECYLKSHQIVKIAFIAK